MSKQTANKNAVTTNPLSADERRRSPRVAGEIPLKIRYADYDIIGQTQDISAIGTYCTLNKYIPPFSVISIILLLPLKNESKTIIANLRCRGVVVRSNSSPNENKQYEIAIYFNRLRESDRSKLSKYVQQFL